MDAAHAEAELDVAIVNNGHHVEMVCSNKGGDARHVDRLNNIRTAPNGSATAEALWRCVVPDASVSRPFGIRKRAAAGASTNPSYRRHARLQAVGSAPPDRAEPDDPPRVPCRASLGAMAAGSYPPTEPRRSPRVRRARRPRLPGHVGHFDRTRHELSSRSPARAAGGARPRLHAGFRRLRERRVLVVDRRWPQASGSTRAYRKPIHPRREDSTSSCAGLPSADEVVSRQLEGIAWASAEVSAGVLACPERHLRSEAGTGESGEERKTHSALAANRDEAGFYVPRENDRCRQPVTRVRQAKGARRIRVERPVELAPAFRSCSTGTREP